MNNRFNLGWGSSVAIRKAFIEASLDCYITFDSEDILKMDYTDHTGDPYLIELTREIIERQTGIKYNHIVLTHGATGGLVVALTALRNVCSAETNVCTTPAPFFRMYPDIIKNAGFNHLQTNDFTDLNPSIILLDSPSNPLGKIHIGNIPGKHTIIFDSVYHTKSYMSKFYEPPAHDINVGSYSKMIGINGIRVGWVATQDGLIYERLKEAAAAHYCGLSHPQATILRGLISNVHWDNFELYAQRKLDANREEWSKLEKYFGGTAVYPVGMFFYSAADQACRDLLDRSGVTYFGGEKLHHTKEYLRINLGQDIELVRDAVKAILAEDKI